MKKILFSLFAITILLTSCGPDPANFNDKLVDILDLGVADYDRISEKFEEMLSAEKYDEVSSVSKSSIDSLTVRIVSVKALEVPTGGKEFRDAVLNYLDVLKEAALAFEDYSVLNKEDCTVDQIEAVNNNIEAKESAFDAAFAKIKTTQGAFAKAKKLKLQ